MKPFAICAIGNSHTAAFTLAWKNRLAETLPGVTITFFAATSQKLESLILEDGAFTTHDAELAESLKQSSGGLVRAQIDAYDAFITIGLGARIDIAVLCDTFGTVEHRAWGQVDNLISKACFTAMVEASFADKLTFWLLDRVRERGHQPFIVCPTPFRSEKQASWTFMRKWRRFADEKLRGPVIAQVQEIGSSFAARKGAEIVWQDEATLGPPGFTRAEFAQGAARLGKPPLEDGMHMNESYGTAMLSRALARIDALSGGRIYGQAEQRTLRLA